MLVDRGAFHAFGAGAKKDKPAKLKSKYVALSSHRSRYIPPVGYAYGRTVIKGVPWETLQKGERPSSAVLLIHGGGFYAQTTDHYRRLMKKAIAGTNALAVLPDYGVMPHNVFPSQIEELTDIYRALTARFEDRILLFGDGVGANLALAVCLKAREEGLAMPKGIVCVSPFVDMTVSGESYYDHFYFDKRFANYYLTSPDIASELRENGVFEYLHGANRQDPLVSPVFADYKEFPPTYIVTGDYSLFESDALALADKMQADGVDVRLRSFPKKYGAYPLDVPFAAKDKKTISDFILSLLGKPTAEEKSKTKKQKTKRVKRHKVSLNTEPIEPQDEEVMLGVGADGSDVVYDEGDPNSFEAVFGVSKEEANPEPVLTEALNASESEAERGEQKADALAPQEKEEEESNN